VSKEKIVVDELARYGKPKQSTIQKLMRFTDRFYVNEKRHPDHQIADV